MEHFSFPANESDKIVGTDSWFNAKNTLTGISKTGKLLSLVLMFSIFTFSCKKETDQNPDILDPYAGMNSQTISELRPAMQDFNCVCYMQWNGTVIQMEFFNEPIR